MPSTSMSNSYNSHSSRSKLVNIEEEIELRERKEKDISPLWKIVTVSSYFAIVVGGITASITIGDLLAAFDNKCIFYARLRVKGLDAIALAGNWTLYKENVIVDNYGSISDCTFSEYCSAASAVFGAIWGILFLQCGRGGITKRGSSPSWQIVPPALLTNMIFFILSCIIFAKTIGGLSYFCNHLTSESETGEPATNITTCKDILSFRFPTDVYNTNLYLNFVLAQIAASITFFGWLIVFFVLILRCFIPVDFVVYGRRLHKVQKSISGEERRTKFAQSSQTCEDDDRPSTSTTTAVVHNSDDGAIATTSFSVRSVPKTKHSKKLS